MRLDTQELTELAAFFAKRFPDHHQRTALARAARVPYRSLPATTASEAWHQLLRTADARRRLHLLAHAAAREDLTDRNLRAVCEVLTGSSNPGQVPLFQRPQIRLGMMAAAVAALAALIVSDPVATPEVVTETALDTQTELAASADQSSALDGSLVAVDPTAPTAATRTDRPWKKDNPLDKPRTAASEAKAPASSNTTKTGTSKRAHYKGRCTIKEGGIVGYWYAGRAAPGAAGDIIEMPNSVNVRLDYPDRHNNYDKRAPLRCTLTTGDRVRLTDAPIAVPGGAYWVPLHSGDLIRD